jgi:hypothetical protein
MKMVYARLGIVEGRMDRVDEDMKDKRDGIALVKNLVAEQGAQQQSLLKETKD